MDSLWNDARLIYYDEKDIGEFLDDHWHQNKLIVKRILIFIRDKKFNGRKLPYRNGIKWIAHNAFNDLSSIINITIKYGCWSDLLYLLGTPAENDIINVFADQLKRDKESLILKKDISTVAKWAPNEKSSHDKLHNFVNKICREMKIRKVDYRKHYLIPLRKTLNMIETTLSLKQWDNINYDSINASSLYMYRRCFKRNDYINYTTYISHHNKINYSKELEIPINAKNTLIMDTSGSMYVHALPIALKIASTLGGNCYNFEGEMNPSNVVRSEEIYCKVHLTFPNKYIYILSDTSYDNLFEHPSERFDVLYPDKHIIHWKIIKLKKGANIKIVNISEKRIEITGFNSDILNLISHYDMDNMWSLEKDYFDHVFDKYK